MGEFFCIKFKWDKTCQGGDESPQPTQIYCSDENGKIVCKSGKEDCRRYIAYNLTGKDAGPQFMAVYQRNQKLVNLRDPFDIADKNEKA